MKFLILLLSFSSLTIAQNRIVTLKLHEEIKVICPLGKVVKLSGEKKKIRCGCPKNSIEVIEGDSLLCENICQLKVTREYDYSEVDVDQGSTGPIYGDLYYRIELKDLFADKILYTKSVDYFSGSYDSFALEKARAIASKECFKTNYKDLSDRDY